MEKEKEIVSGGGGGGGGFDLPPGFRFHPSDEELIVHYLLKKVNLHQLPAAIIGDIMLYNFDPWELPEKAMFGEDEWYFFSPREKKYPNGLRPNRAAGSGFWKATGKDKQILSSWGSRKIGLKKGLVFYTGHPRKCAKTNWTMNEYRLPNSTSSSSKLKGSMRLDDWVLCRVRQKGNKSNKGFGVQQIPKNKVIPYLPTTIQELPSSYKFTKANLDITADHRFKDFQLMASILIGQDPSNEKVNINNNSIASNNLTYDNCPFKLINDDNTNHDDDFSMNVSTKDVMYDEDDITQINWMW